MRFSSFFSSLTPPLLVSAMACLALPAAAAEDAPHAYDENISIALGASEKKDWPAARAAFLAAHEAYPSAKALRGAGMVSFEMADYVAAYRFLLASILEDRRALSDKQSEEVRALLKRVRPLIARYTTRNLPEGTSIEVDSAPAELEPDGALLIAKGSHQIRLTLGERVEERSLQIDGGEEGPLLADISWETPPAEEEPTVEQEPEEIVPAATEPEAPPPPPARPDDSGSLATVGVVAGGVMAVAGTALFIIGLRDISKVENAEPGSSWSDVSANNDRAPLYTGLGLGLMGGGIALSGISLWMQVEPTPTGPQEAMLGVRGDW